MTSDRHMGTPDDVVAERLAEIRRVISEVGSDDVSIVAVTKGFDRSAIDCATRLGLNDIGENYAQELLEKVDAIEPSTNVHFMGRIQRNKVRKIIDHVDLWHSVSRPEILTEIGKRGEAARVLIQVRPHDDETKDGVRPDEIDGMLTIADSAGVVVEGLMTIGVMGDAPATAAAFAELDRIASQFGLRERSMGMSGDYRDALVAGATILRLGSILFGSRPQRDG